MSLFSSPNKLSKSTFETNANTLKIVFIINKGQIFLRNKYSALYTLKKNWKGQVTQVFDPNVTVINRF